MMHATDLSNSGADRKEDRSSKGSGSRTGQSYFVCISLQPCRWFIFFFSSCLFNMHLNVFKLLSVLKSPADKKEKKGNIYLYDNII